jgi:hypothetical protein
MKGRLVRSVPLVLLLLLPACQRVANEPGSGPSSAPVKRQDGDLIADEVKDYLDGKTLELPEDAQPGGAEKGKDGRRDGQGGVQKGHSLTIRKANIKALSIGNGSSVNNEPWVHEITFLYNSGTESYAVVGQVEHRLVEGRQAFFGFKVNRVAKQ